MRKWPDFTRPTGTAVALLAVTASGAALAQQPVVFKASEYGRANLRVNESTGNASGFFAVQKGAFEPLNMFPANDPIRLAAKPVGRVDVLVKLPSGEEGVETCTGALLAGDFVITNHHCLPQSGGKRPVKASIVMDYLQADGAGSERFELALKPEDFSEARDFVVVKATGNPTAKYGFVRLASVAADPGQPLMIFHHPMGRPKVMTRVRCFAMASQPEKQVLHHQCDTMPGSSGSLILSNRGETLALHFSGGLSADDATSYNIAVRMADILANSAILQGIVAHQGGTAADASASTTPSTTPTSAPPARIDTGASATPRPNEVGRLFTEDEINHMLRN